MLISTMYHHVNSDRCSNNYEVFEAHLKYVSENFTSVFPKKELPKHPICLVFDDGYYDFYTLIFPLLKKYKIKALLAVTPKYILDETDKPDSLRLSYEHNDLFQNYKDATFCTYKELKEMLKSNLIQVVSHSYSHKNLLENDVDLNQELVESKNILEKKLGIIVESFVFPFGKYNQKVLNETRKHYKYSFRIGNAVNNDFHGVNDVIYRIDADNLTQADEIFSFSHMLKFRLKALSKKIVGNT
ncbi:MAG: polysaccharide deacetylase family protein [Flavobacteriales bacterium]|nr:polysaccharide deacetylase family protein [Flavobacteriales bacterium]